MQLAVGKDQEQPLPHRLSDPAARAEQRRGLELLEGLGRARVSRSLRDAAMQTIKGRNIQIYAPSAQEMKAWRDYGAQFMASDVVTSSVSKATLDEALKAQK